MPLIAIALFAVALASGAASAAQGPSPDAGASTAASAPSSDAGLSASGEVPLTKDDQAKELCAALRGSGGAFDGDPAEVAAARIAADDKRATALRHTYRLEVPSKGFAFGRYRAGENLLELDGDRPLRALAGALSLDLEGIDDVAFAARPEQVSQWSKDKKAGALKLVAVFRPDGERCAGSAAAKAFRLGGRALSWQIVDGEQVVAAANEAGEPVGGAAGSLAVRVESVSLDSDPAAPSDEGRERLSAAQRSLEKCAAGAPRGGSLVVTFAVQAGRVREPQVIMDALHDDGVSRCVSRALSGASLVGAAGANGRGTAAIMLQ